MSDDDFEPAETEPDAKAEEERDASDAEAAAAPSVESQNTPSTDGKDKAPEEENPESVADETTEEDGRNSAGEPPSPSEDNAGDAPKAKKPLNPKLKVAIAVVIAAVAIFGIAYAATNGFHQHRWSDATCTQPKTCTECGATEGEALGHDYKATKVAATCTEAGHTHYLCTRCRDAYDEETGEAALGHEPGDWTYDSTTKRETRKCTRCGSVFETRDVTKESLATYLAGWKATIDECYKWDSGSNLKSLYRDMIVVAITNHSSKAIRSASIIVSAWDESGNPVTIGYLTTGDSYRVNANDINIQPGETWDGGSLNKGWDIAYNLTSNISKIEGVIASVTYADGTTETNPYANAWVSLYSGKAN